jgi:hypothetical protein
MSQTVLMRSRTTVSSCCACCRLSMRPCHGHACWAVSSAAFLAFLASLSMTQEKSMRRIAASRCSSLLVSLQPRIDSVSRRTGSRKAGRREGVVGRLTAGSARCRPRQWLRGA